MLENKITEKRMASVLACVAMDIALPFYDVMGLTLLDKNVFLETLKRVVQDNRRQSDEQGTPAPIIESISKAIADELGKDIRDRFFEWSICTFVDAPQDHLHSLGWQFVLRGSSTEPLRWNRLILPEPMRESLRLEFRKMSDYSEVEKLEEGQKDESLSAWDADMYARQGFNEFEIDPYDCFVNTASRYRFLQALEHLVSHLNSSEIEEFRASVNRVALQEGYSNIEELKGPHDLREPAY